MTARRWSGSPEDYSTFKEANASTATRASRVREIDHLIPWSYSDDDGLDNLVAAMALQMASVDPKVVRSIPAGGTRTLWK